MRLPIVLICLFTVFSCKKVVVHPGFENLPKRTFKGKGVFACYIGNETYIAKRQEPAVYNKKTGYLYLSSTYDGYNFRFFIYEGVFSEGFYNFDYTGEEFIKSSHYQGKYALDTLSDSWLAISKLDTEKDIISAEFQATLINNYSNDTISISQGSLDLELSYTH